MNLSPGLKYMAVSAFSYSVMAVFVKLLGKAIPPHELIVFRSTFILAISLPLVYRRGRGLFGRHYGRLIARGVFGWIALGTYYWTLAKMHFSDAVVVQYTNPVFTTLFAAWFLKEKPPSRLWVVILGCLIGMVAVAKPGFGEDPLVVSVGIVSAICTGVAYMLVRSMKGKEDPYTIVFYFPLVSLPLSLYPAITSWVSPTLNQWLYILGVAICSYSGQIFLTKSLERESAGKAVTVNYLIIIFAAISGLLVFGEPPDVWSILGMVLIIGSLSRMR